MLRKLFFLMLLIVLFLAILVACAKTPQQSGKVDPTSVQPIETKVVATSTIQPSEIVATPIPTEVEASVTETEVVDLCSNSNNPCDCLGKSYQYNQGLGEIKEEYIGSWHAAASVGSGYNERFVFFSSGNYLFFPSQYECDFNDQACKPSPIEEGIWGIQDDQMNLAKEGNIDNLRSIPIGKVIDAPPDESPYPYKTTIDGTTYWLLSKETNMWNPETGEFCDGF